MILSLRTGERVFVNGAIVRVDRRVNIELLNNASFLLEAYTINPESADTTIKQIYFLLQCILIDQRKNDFLWSHLDTLSNVITNLTDIKMIPERELSLLAEMLKSRRIFHALKILRSIHTYDERFHPEHLDDARYRLANDEH